MHSVRNRIISAYLQSSIGFNWNQCGIPKSTCSSLNYPMICFLSPNYSKHIAINGTSFSGIYQLEKNQSLLISGKFETLVWIHQSSILAHADPKVQETHGKVQPPNAVKKKKKPLLKRVHAELKHYYHGFRLFFIDVKVASKLTWKKLQGQQLSRREQALLVRTLGDVFRLVPFLVIISVPFMEFTLPILLKIFPGMLPSTFQTKSEKARKSDELVSSDELIKYSKLFEDEITVDNLPRPQIVALCRVMEITPIGITPFLRYQLKLKLRNLQIDDKIIQKEGLNSMTYSELKEACRVRGMRFIGVSEERLKDQLQQWLDLSLIKKIPPSLLLLSQAFMLSDTTPSEKTVAATIQALPSEVGTATKAVIGEREGEFDYETEVNVIKDELSKINEEKIEVQKEELDKRKKSLLGFYKDSQDMDTMVHETIKKMDATASIELALLENILESKLYIEKDCLAELKNDLQQYETKVKNIRKVLFNPKKDDIAVETLVAKRLHSKLLQLMKKLEEIIISIEQSEKEALKMSPDDTDTPLSPDVIVVEDILNKIKQRKGEKAAKGDLLSHILYKLDHDKNGRIRISKVSKLLKLLENEKLTINSESIDEVIKLILKEERVALEEKKQRTFKT